MLGDQCLIQIKTWSEYIIPYKTEVATDVTDVKMLLILIMNKNVTASLTQAKIKCVFLRDKKGYYYHSYEATQTGFLIWNNINSLEHAETKKYIYFR